MNQLSRDQLKRVLGGAQQTLNLSCSDATPCPLNLCCSWLGYCGSTSDYCMGAPESGYPAGSSCPCISGPCTKCFG